MFAAAFIATVLLAASTSVSATVVPRHTKPSTYYESWLEPYDTYHARYLALDCRSQHKTPFFDDCCHPLMKTETLAKNRKAYCVPAPSVTRVQPAPGASADPIPQDDDDEEDCEDDDAPAVVPSAKPTAPADDDEEDCEDDDEPANDDDEDCEDEEDAPAATTKAAAPAKPTPTPDDDGEDCEEGEPDCVCEDIEPAPASHAVPTSSVHSAPPAHTAAATKPASTAVAATKPASTAVAATKPASSAAQATNPASTAVAASNPASTAVAATNPASTAVAATNPASTAVAATNPASTAVAASNPASTAVAASNPASTAVAATNPASTAVAASNPASTAVAATKPASTAVAATKPASSAAEPTKPAATSTPNVPLTQQTTGTVDGGFATYFIQDSAGACGNWHGDDDMIAAIDGRRYGNLDAVSHLCGKKVRVTNTQNGKSVDVTIADACPTCKNSGSIDLSQGAFTKIATIDEGMVSIKFTFL